MSISKILLGSLLLSVFLPLSMANTDDADSLDFESFHSTDKKSSQKIVKPISIKTPQLADDINIDLYKASASYDASDSLNVLKALASLYQQMDARCAGGWIKKSEWAEFRGGKQQLNNEFGCR